MSIQTHTYAPSHAYQMLCFMTSVNMWAVAAFRLSILSAYLKGPLSKTSSQFARVNAQQQPHTNQARQHEGDSLEYVQDSTLTDQIEEASDWGQSTPTSKDSRDLLPLLHGVVRPTPPQTTIPDEGTWMSCWYCRFEIYQYCIWCHRPVC